MALNPKDLDPSRQMDYVRYQKKLADPNLPEERKKAVQNALYAIEEQARSKAIAKDRERLFKATQNGDREKAEKIAEEMKRRYDEPNNGYR